MATAFRSLSTLCLLLSAPTWLSGCIESESCAADRSCLVEMADASTAPADDDGMASPDDSADDTGNQTDDSADDDSVTDQLDASAGDPDDDDLLSDGGGPPVVVVVGRCGDGFMNAGEDCDDGDEFNIGSYGGCNADCTLAGYCGDGVVDPQEQCETVSGDAGTATDCPEGCGVNPVCGDGQRTPDEECDLAEANNTGSYGGCNPDCTLAPYCGNGTPDPDTAEECDPGQGNFSSAYGGCQSNCTLAAYCGDGARNGDEQCDEGAANNTGAFGGCNPDCTRAPLCDPASATPTDCGGQCVNTQSDEDHCGMCGIKCNPGYACESGKCQLVCGGGESACNNQYCADLSNDVNNCNACGMTCAAPAANGKAECSNSQCGFDCDGSYEACGNTCVDARFGKDTCGTCGNLVDCPEPSSNGTAVCNERQCGTSCNNGYSVCGTECYNLQNDPQHCGSCDIACPGSANGSGTAKCNSGSCVIECGGGRNLCSVGQGAGCFDLSTDVQHCGACNDPCDPKPGASVTCGGGQCKYSCPNTQPLSCHTEAQPACGLWDWSTDTLEGWRYTKHYDSDFKDGDLRAENGNLVLPFDAGAYPRDYGVLEVDLCGSTQPTNLLGYNMSLTFSVSGASKLLSMYAEVVHSNGDRSSVLNINQLENKVYRPDVVLSESDVTKIRFTFYTSGQSSGQGEIRVDSFRLQPSGQ